jgi:hypothetical protein
MLPRHWEAAVNRLSIASALALLSAATTGCDSRGASPEASAPARPSASPSASATATSVAGAACVPQVVVLPRLDDGSGTSLVAMNDSGWAVGQSLNWEDEYQTAVMWRDGAVIDLGLGGGPVLNGRVSSSAVDINEDGIVAAQRWRNNEKYQVVAQTSWLWQDGFKERLRGTKQFPRAFVQAVNDDGVAVGYVTDKSTRDLEPVVWRSGARERLPIPAGTNGGAVGINNRGLVVGTVSPRGDGSNLPNIETRFWYWRLGGGKSGPLTPTTGAQMIDVDNHDRILGQIIPYGKSQVVLWRGPSSRGRVLRGAVPPGTDTTSTGVDNPETTDMNDHGDLTGYRGGNRGEDARPWVSHLGAQNPTRLPKPPQTVGWGWATHATSVIRGVTWFAPQGGVSVGGHTLPSSNGVGGDAVIWTCTQTY